MRLSTRSSINALTILAIDTSCDETSAAVLDGARVLSSVTWSQIKYHRRWGGVVPSLARRAHEERLPLVINKAINGSRLTINGIGSIAVTVGPGLAPALEAGIYYAKDLALLHEIPLIPVNHLEGHIASVFLRRKTNSPYLPNLPNLPNFLSLIVSGGHTELVQSAIPNSFFLLPSSFFLSHRLLGQTMDDAAGECLDKVGRELGLGYPAGPVVEQLTRQGNLQKYKFPIPLQRSPRADLNFSFSGLKTAAIQMIHGTHNIEKAGKRQELSRLANLRVRLLPSEATRPAARRGGLAPSDSEWVTANEQISPTRQPIYDFCASFQEAVINALLFKLKRAIQLTGVKTVILTGGVAANNRLRRRAAALVRSLGGNFYAAPKQFTGDNAAMIGLAAHWALAREEAAKTPIEINAIDRQPNLNFPAL